MESPVTNLPTEDSAANARRSSYWICAFGAVLVTALFAYHVRKYYFLGDDAFISFRYALNLVEGHGLVYNLGDRVEGYTNFSWVILMAAFMKMGLAPEVISNVIGIAAGAGVLFLLLKLGAKSSGWGSPFIWIAPLALAMNRTFAAWSTGGLETQLFSFLVLAGVVRFIGERAADTRRPWGSALLLAGAALTRPEGLLFFGIVALVFAWESLVFRRRSLQSFLLWLGVFVIPVGAHIAWRCVYYGSLVPNTFHAKVSGLWLDQGWRYLNLFLGDHCLWWFLPLLPAAVFLKRDVTSALFGSAVVLYTAYVLAVGGDRFEFRFMVVILPYLFWLLQEAIREAVRRWGAPSLRRWSALPAGVVAGLLILVSAYLPNALEYRGLRHGVTHLEAMERYAARRAGEGRFLRSLVEEGYLAGDELLAVGGAGALPYYSRLPVVDVLGLNDKWVARMDVRERGIVGHEKRAPFEYLQERGVVMYDVMNGLVRPEHSPEPRRPVISLSYYKGPLRCVRVKGRHLLFATTLDDEAFRDVFRRFEIIY